MPKMSSHLVKTNKNNGAIVEKGQWGNSKKVNGPKEYVYA
jgi:putative transposon-encoded protein